MMATLLAAALSVACRSAASDRSVEVTAGAPELAAGGVERTAADPVDDESARPAPDPSTCEARSAVLRSSAPSVHASWAWSCAAGSVVLEWWSKAPGTSDPRSSPSTLEVPWSTWERLWAALDATSWNDLYDECDGQPVGDARHELALIDGDRYRAFSCAGSSLPTPFPQIARAIRSEPSEAELVAALAIAEAQFAAVRPSEVEDLHSGDCDGMAASWRETTPYGYTEGELRCHGDRVVHRATQAGLSGSPERAKPKRLGKQAWARLWSTLAALDWRRLASSCPAPAPDDDRAFRTKSVTLSITDRHGTRSFSCNGWARLPEPYAALLEALQAVAR